MDNSHNQIFNLAKDIIANTNRSVFLTGKAGTGKTTFLRHIQHNVDKNIIVAAPTGVAAINAGGVTLHSLLQMPFEAFTPDYEGKKKMDYHFNLRKSKIEMLQELDLLTIDEVSMLRADTLDAIDYLLRRYRNSQEVFGGVQMLFIGDLFQLPPVVQKQEWEKLRNFYASPFFFHAQALNDNMPLYIELKTVYRQSDEDFIGILNRIRNNQTTRQDLEILNKKYHPNFKPKDSDRYVTLCTHNAKTDRINQDKLKELKGKEYSFSGKVKGDFAENSFPTELTLSLKKGAQVMFVKNDVGEFRRYYNGKLATICDISDDKIYVEFENGDTMELEAETWRNVRYSLNEKTGEISEEEIGSFAQYPIRLAWAITIHKSQGLTFERVIIDAGQAFAAGQVYVALSRCTSLDGIVLYSQITPSSIQTDNEAIRFSKQELPLKQLEMILEVEKPRYCAQRLRASFIWTPLISTLRTILEFAKEKKIPQKEETIEMFSTMLDKASEQETFALSFCRELDRILFVSNPNMIHLRERVVKASIYFHKEIVENILVPLNDYENSIKNKARIKLYLKEVRATQAAVVSFLEKIENIHFGDINLTANVVYEDIPVVKELEEKAKKKTQKGDSKLLTLSLFKEGKSVSDIAVERDLKAATIENHLVEFIRSGDVQIEDLMPKEEVEHLSGLLKAYTLKTSLKEIKENIPQKYTYLDIKAVLNYLSKEI